MRGPGDYQRAQMKRIDPRIGQMFHHLRALVSVLEQITLHPHLTPDPPAPMKIETRAVPPPPTLDPTKLAYTVKELCKVLGVSRSKIYHAMKNKELRAVKCGNRTLVMAKGVEAWINAWLERR